MIVMQDVCVAFDGRPVLRDINCTLSEKRIGIIGANGSGKSTFLRLLNGLQLPQSGTVTVGGINTDTGGKLIRRKVGFVFQNPDNQIVMPTVEEDLAFGLKNLKLDKKEISARIDAVLSHYQLQNVRTQASHLLSGGQKQLLAICGVLAMGPDIIVFDEPTTQLDLRNKRAVMEAVHALSQQVIMASHDLDYLDDFDRVLVFDNGNIICDDRPSQAVSYYRNIMAP